MHGGCRRNDGEEHFPSQSYDMVCPATKICFCLRFGAAAAIQGICELLRPLLAKAPEALARTHRVGQDAMVRLALENNVATTPGLRARELRTRARVRKADAETVRVQELSAELARRAYRDRLSGIPILKVHLTLEPLVLRLRPLGNPLDGVPAERLAVRTLPAQDIDLERANLWRSEKLVGLEAERARREGVNHCDLGPAAPKPQRSAADGVARVALEVAQLHPKDLV
mmetsp:Transcript_79085/g.229693  ORF Transcript_79085/g.229693 Transcript_79085/m.229693 type:complete len:228 (-) Transcript_79085:1206-1889(-)